MSNIEIKEELPFWGNKDSPKKRRFISVYWKCCHSFSRLYKSKDGSKYQGKCPKCGSYCSAPVGPEGTSQRIFFAG